MKIIVQVLAVKALLHFQDLNYICFTFEEIDTPSTIEEYVQILNFLKNLDKVYFRKRIGDTTTEVTKLVHLDKISQYRTTNGSFKWKLIEAKLKIKKKIRGSQEMKDTKQLPFSYLGQCCFHQKLLRLSMLKPLMLLLNMSKRGATLLKLFQLRLSCH